MDKKTVTLTIFSLLILFNSNAQEQKPVRWNFKFTYLVGFQFFNNDVFRANLERRLLSNMRYEGFIDRKPIIPTQWHRFIISSTIFKNKKWYFSLIFDYGRTKGSYTGYTSDINGNPYKAIASSKYSYFTMEYGFGKEISLKKWGTIIPKLSFAPGGFEYEVTNHLDYFTFDKSTGQITSSAYNIGGGLYENSRTGILMLFDSPRIGVDWEIKVSPHFSTLLSYSYWIANSMINSLYGLSKDYLIKPYNFFTANKPSTQYYSHNISIGLSYKLFK